MQDRIPQIYGVYLKPDNHSNNADTFNAINRREAREMAQMIKGMSTTVDDKTPNRRPIRLLATGNIENRITFGALAKEIDVTPIFPSPIFESPLTKEKASALIDEYIHGGIDAAYVIAVGSKEEGVLLMDTILKKLFGREIHRTQIEVMIDPGWKINMGTGYFRSINNPEFPAT